MKQQLFLIIAFFSAITLNAQNAIPSSGGEAIGTGGTFSFTFGQVFYTTAENTFSVSQGVQQTFKVIQGLNVSKTVYTPQITAAVVDAPIINASVYPNPVANYIVLSIGNLNVSNLNYNLYDVNGRTIASGLIHQKQTTISFPYIVPGSYILQVIQHTKQLKSFIIIKK